MRKKLFEGPPSPPPPRKELSDSPLKLCNEISRIFRAKRRSSENAEGVMTQPGAHLVLSFLAIGDGTTQLDLVKATHLKAPTVSVILKKMEAEGMVRRENDPNDLRAIRVYLTEYGRKLDRLNIENIKKINQLSLKGLSSEEEETLMRLLMKLRDNLIQSEKEENGKKE